MAQVANGAAAESRPKTWRCFTEEDVAVFECQSKNDSRITAAVAVERPARGHITTESPDGEKTAPLYVHRITNGVPMLDTNASTNCALVVGVAGAGWRSLGLKISAPRVSQSEGRLRFILSEAPTPLKVKGGAPWSALADIKAVHVALAVNAETLPYTSLRKDGIAQKEGYVAATSNAVREGLLSLSNREVGGFRSAAEAAREMMHEDLIPLMASSIASAVESSEDLSFQKNCLKVLGVGNEYMQQARLTEFLVSEVEDTLMEEEKRRAAAKARAAARREEKAQQARKASIRRKQQTNNP